MKITLKLFAALREALGVESQQVELAEASTVADLIEQLIRQDKKWQPLTADHVLVAVNQTMAEPTMPLSEGDEVAFFPPVTGG